MGYYFEDMDKGEHMGVTAPIRLEEAGETCKAESAFYFYVKNGNLQQLRILLEKERECHSLFPVSCRRSISGASLRAVELMTIAKIATVQSGGSGETSYSITSFHIESLNECDNFADILKVLERCSFELAALAANVTGHKGKKYSQLTNNCISCILERLPQKISLKDLAECLHVTPKYLSSVFNKETGRSITEFMQNIRIDQAKHMLVYSSLSFAEISNILCFGSQSYFNQVFKANTGITPSEYRKRGTDDSPFGL